MEDNLKYIVYLTTNLENKKIYIGVHKTENPDIFDGYLGNGIKISRPSTYEHPKTAFQFAVRKYGIKHFLRTTLKVCDTLEEALQLEAVIVDENFIKRKDVYNMTLGGGLPNDHSIEVFQYDLTGNFIKSWSSATDAAHFFNIASNNIRLAIKLKRQSHNFLWSEICTERLDVSEYSIFTEKEKIYKFDTNNKLIKTFNSVKDAASEANSSERLIFNALSGQTKSKGYYYSYNPEFIIDKDVYKRVTSLYIYNMDGTFYKEFASPRECAEFFGDKKTSRIYAALRTGGLYKSYQISTTKVPFMKSLQKSNAPKKVGQYTLDGELIKVWDTIQSAYLEYGPGVKKCLKGTLNKTKGFVFKYL